MSIFPVIRYIASHPLNQQNKIQAVRRFIKWQIASRLNPYPIIFPFTEKAKLIVQKGMTGATGNLYCGLHEYDDMAFLLHFLRPEDLFVDIGANIGSYTVLASGHVGAAACSIEPVPSTFSHLCNNIRINNVTDKVKAFNIAMGAQQGSIDFTRSFDTVNHVASEGETDTIKVPIDTLDNILQGQGSPSLLKIDVEGFETEVIRGASNTLQQQALKAIIIELNGSGARYGYNEQWIHDTLVAAGFSTFQYDPRGRILTAIDQFGIGTHNTIYLRDAGFVRERIKTAPPIKVLGQEL